jgi:hypothetical protein
MLSLPLGGCEYRDGARTCFAWGSSNSIYSLITHISDNLSVIEIAEHGEQAPIMDGYQSNGGKASIINASVATDD